MTPEELDISDLPRSAQRKMARLAFKGVRFQRFQDRWFAFWNGACVGHHIDLGLLIERVQVAP